jgi:hypothetical protein
MRPSARPRSTAHTTSPLPEQISALLRRAQPFAYCDDCLARYFTVSLSIARRAARDVGAAPGFMRQTRRCRGCQRLGDVTWRVRPLSVFSAPGNPGRSST